jgi:hypothetical protein
VKPDQFADAGDVEEGARVAKVALEKKAEVKLVLVDDIARLRDEQTAVIDRVEIVLAELDEKGGDSGEQHKYITAVRGVTVDVHVPGGRAPLGVQHRQVREHHPLVLGALTLCPQRGGP